MKKPATIPPQKKIDRSSIYVTIKKWYTHLDGTKPLILIVRINGKKKEFALNITVHPNEWDDTNRCFLPALAKRIGKGACRDHQLLIDMKLGIAKQIVLEYRLKNESLTVDAFAFEFNNPYDKEDFLEYMHNRIRARYKQKQISDETLRLHLNTYNYLKELFIKIRFADLNYDVLYDFEKFLKYKKSLQHGTVWKHLKQLKTYVIEAQKSGLQLENPFDVYVLKTPKWGGRDYLNQKELKDLFAFYRTNSLLPHLHRELFNFLFSCFTGLRHSDMRRSDQWVIIDDVLIFNEYKNRRFGKEVKIPLNAMAKELLAEKENTCLETISNQKTNRYLKIIAEAAGIKKNLTSHVARHTFATQFLSLGGRVEVLQKLLAHSKIETTMQYVHIMEEDKKAQISVFDKVEWKR